ncbi:MAG: hypothetical protein BJ554DRAFT_2671, partial [Olpidium bornovanus]
MGTRSSAPKGRPRPAAARPSRAPLPSAAPLLRLLLLAATLLAALPGFASGAEDSQTAQQHINEGNAHLAKRDFEAALRNFEQAVGELSGKLPAASATFRERQRNGCRVSRRPIDPLNYLSHFKKAATHLSLGRHSAALSDFDRVIELKPDFNQAIVQRAKILLRQGDLDQVAKDAKDVLRLGGDGIEAAKELLAAVQRTQSSTEEAEKAEERKDYGACVKHATIAAEGASAQISLRLRRARCNFASGETEEAIGDLTRVAALDPSAADPLITLAELNYYVLDNPDVAMRNVKQCLHYDPEHKTCKALFRKFKNLTKLLEKVVADSKAGRWASATGRLTGTGAAGAGTKGLLAEQEEAVKDIVDRLEIKETKLPKTFAARLYELACQGYST